MICCARGADACCPNDKFSCESGRTLAELNARLADPAIYEEPNKRELQQCLLEKADLDRQCEAAEEEWMAAAEALENHGREDD